MERKEYQLHDLIFREHEYQKWMYSICEGAVDICSGYGTTQEKKLITLTEGQFFGEIGLIAMMPRTATAVAAADSVVLEQIGEDDLEDYLKKHPENLRPIMSNVSRRIRELTEDLSLVMQMTTEALNKKESGDSLTGWLKASVQKLFGRLKEKKAFDEHSSIVLRRQQALAGQMPPVIYYSAGDVIFRAGDESDCMYDICDGCVGIYSDYRTENEKLLAELYADEVFGEMGILDNMPRSATAVCLKDCSVMVVKPENFMHFFRDKPEKVLQILQRMCTRLRKLTNTYLQVCQALEQMQCLEENDFREDAALAQLELIQQTQLCSSMYDVSFCTDYWYNHL